MNLLCPPNYCMVKKKKYNNSFVGSISDSYECIHKDNMSVPVPVSIVKDSDENSSHLKEMYHTRGFHNKNCDSSTNVVVPLNNNSCNNFVKRHNYKKKNNNLIIKKVNKKLRRHKSQDDFTLIIYYTLISVIIIEIILIFGCACRN